MARGAAKRTEEFLQENLHCLKSLERLDQTIRNATDMEQLMGDALDVARDIMDADRAWLVSPCDPASKFWSVPMERGRPEHPGVSALGLSNPVTPPLRKIFKAVSGANDPVAFGPGGDRPLDQALRQTYAVQSFLAMALHPKVDKPWLFGVHQCAHARVHTPTEKMLFKAMGGRIGDALNNLLLLRGLRESEARYRGIFENAMEGIYLTSFNEGKILDANPAVARTFGYATPREFIEGLGITRSLYADPEDRGRFVSRLLAEGKVTNYLVPCLRRDGTKMWLLENARLIRDEEGKPLHIAGVTLDVTERILAEQSLRDALARAEDLAVKAEAASLAKDQFLANMSHEIRTPLNGILGMLQLLQTTSPDAEQQEYLLAAITSSKRLTRLLTDILDLSRMESNRLAIQEADFEIDALQQALLELFAAAAKEKGLRLACDLDGRIPPRLVGDEPRLRQILFNLVGNAVKFTEQGTVTIHISLVSKPSESPCRLLFSVADTGIGIPADRLKDLFEPFTQVDGSYVRRHQGAGLGLAIVRGIVHLMGGNLALESEPGAGTTVRFVLPFAVAGQKPTAAKETTPAPSGHAPRTCSILLVEDETINRIAMQRMLEKGGYGVVTASDGAEALRLAAGNRFDLILMDIQMPVMDGVEATRLIRADATGKLDPRTPIIAITAYSTAEDRKMFLASGMDDFIAKPVERKALLRIIDAVLRRRASQPG